MTTPLNPTGAPSVFGGIGRLEWAPNDTADAPFPTWVDITPYVRAEDTALQIVNGRQTELDTIQSAMLTCLLDNTDSRFTYGYTAGPYGANWQPNKQIRYLETIGPWTARLFKGWIEAPDIDDWRPIGYQEVSLAALDRQTKFGRGRPFVSVLGAHIMSPTSARNGALKAYYPLSESAPSFGDATSQQVAITPSTSSISGPMTVQSATQYANRIIGPADDLTSAVFANELVTPTSTSVIQWQAALTGITVTAGQLITVVCWVSPDAGVLTAVNTPVAASISFGTFGQLEILFNATALPLAWQLLGTHPGGNTSANPLPATYAGMGYPVAFQVDPFVGTVSIWVRDKVFTTTFTSPQGSTFTVDLLQAAFAYFGGLGHLQLYVGAPADYTQADFLAQFAVGLYGLEGQLSGQRVNTMLDYAGVASTDRLVDPGQSVMQHARLAGVDPWTAIQNAVNTERGRGFADGLGRLVFHDRIRTYNV